MSSSGITDPPAPSLPRRPSLLLLPPPPSPATREALDAAYRAPFSAVLTRLSTAVADDDDESGALLVVAVACPVLDRISDFLPDTASPRFKYVHWNTAQSLLADLYTIISSICADHAIPVDVGAGRRGVDARIVLVDHDRGRTYYPEAASTTGSNGTAVLDVATFASGAHNWQTIFHPSSEAAYELLNVYLKFAEGKQTILQNQLVEVQSGVSLSTSHQQNRDASGDGRRGDELGYDSVCLGGTFDHLHPGHKLLLHAAALLLCVPKRDSGKVCELVVGISGDALLKNKKYAEELQPWDYRARAVLSVLSTILDISAEVRATTAIGGAAEGPDELQATLCNGTVLVRCVNIPDPFGPTITEEAIEAIVVSGETRGGGYAINDKRRDKAWDPLEVYEIDVLDTRGVGSEAAGDAGTGAKEDFADKISSTAIRRQRAEARAGGG